MKLIYMCVWVTRIFVSKITKIHDTNFIYFDDTTLCFYHHSLTAEVQYKHSCSLISVIKLHVSSVYTDHHKASYKTVYIKDKYYTLGLNFVFCWPWISI
jgi:hypothetical protein